MKDQVWQRHEWTHECKNVRIWTINLKIINIYKGLIMAPENTDIIVLKKWNVVEINQYLCLKDVQQKKNWF